MYRHLKKLYIIFLLSLVLTYSYMRSLIVMSLIFIITSIYLGKILKEISGEDANNLSSIIKVETDLDEITVKPEINENNGENDIGNNDIDEKDFIINTRNFFHLQ